MRYLVLIPLLLWPLISYCEDIKDSIFIKRKYNLEGKEYIEYDTVVYNNSNIPVQLIHGNDVLKYTAGQSNSTWYGLRLDSVSVENLGFNEKYFAFHDSIIIENETDTSSVISIILPSNMDNMFFLVDMNTDNKSKEIQLWAYPYFLNKQIGPNVTFFKLKYNISKNPWLDKKRNKFKYTFKNIIP